MRRVGDARHGPRWYERAAAGARGGIRSLARRAGERAERIADPVARSLRMSPARSEAGPWDDRRLFTGLSVFAVAAVALSLLLGFGVADWMRTEPGALPIAGAGAVAVGALLLPLACLVFASRRRRPPARKRD